MISERFRDKLNKREQMFLFFGEVFILIAEKNPVQTGNQMESYKGQIHILLRILADYLPIRANRTADLGEIIQALELQGLVDEKEVQHIRKKANYDN